MRSLKLNPVFHLFVWLAAVQGLVEVPTNVTLQCGNLHNILTWSYSQLLPGLRFRVDVGRYYGTTSVLWVDPPALEVDLSYLSDPYEVYYVDVTAVIGQNQSDPAPPEGITFSYIQDSPAPQICFLDLPSVNVTAQSYNRILFSFTHPWLVYQQGLSGHQKPKLRKKKSYEAHMSKRLPKFTYDVNIVSEKWPSHDFSCAKSVCEQTLPVEPEQKKHCLSITGELQNMGVKPTQLYCAVPLTEVSPGQNDYIIYIVCGSLVVCVAAFVLFLVYKKQTAPASALPKSILIHPKIQGTIEAAGVEDQIAVAEVEPSSPTPLLSYPEKSEFTSATTPPSEPDFRVRLGGSAVDDVACDDMEVEQPKDEGHGYTGGKDLDDDGTLESSGSPSDYERRPVLVELGLDELAQGYHVREKEL